ncbi:MAG TPA: TetR/AcrR family transcriptional regulator [Arenicellales bacterium]|nr:TetR/AcrR family transcriptional regulator [Arenicellales bacterium]
MPDSSTKTATGRDEILAAATDLFGEAGFDAVSISSIAAKAGTSKANVFHHFGCKEKLYLEVMRMACQGFAGAHDSGSAGAGAFGERLSALLRHDIEFMRANPDRSHVILREVLESGDSRGRALAGDVFAEQFADLVALFEEAQANGGIRREVPAELAAIVLIACKVFLFQSQNVLRHLPGVDFVDDVDRYSQMVSDVLLEGLRHRPESASKGN